MRSRDFPPPLDGITVPPMAQHPERDNRRADLARVILALALLAGIAAFSDAPRAAPELASVAVNPQRS